MNPPPIPAETPDITSFEKVRSGQRFVLLTILLNLLMIGMSFLVPKNDLLMAFFGYITVVALLASLVLGFIGVIRLCSGLGYGIAARIAIIISLFIPCVSLLVLLVLTNKATTVLRAAGYKVGLSGAAPKTN